MFQILGIIFWIADWGLRESELIPPPQSMAGRPAPSLEREGGCAWLEHVGGIANSSPRHSQRDAFGKSMAPAERRRRAGASQPLLFRQPATKWSPWERAPSGRRTGKKRRGVLCGIAPACRQAGIVDFRFRTVSTNVRIRIHRIDGIFRITRRWCFVRASWRGLQTHPPAPSLMKRRGGLNGIEEFGMGIADC